MATLRVWRNMLALELAVVLAPTAALAQVDFSVDAPTRGTVVGAAADDLAQGYIFPDAAAAMALDIRSRLARGAYDSVTSANAFATLLTSQLRAISHDKHIIVEASAAPVPEASTSVEPPAIGAERQEHARRESAFINFGFRRVERLRGNIGYLALSAFERVEFGRETAAAAMRFVANTDALIIDLRDNDGGRPEMVALLISYLMERPTQLTGIYWRRDRRIAESRTVEIPDGLKYLGKKVYILTSNTGTVSAAEAFAYDLQLLKRATLVGETSAGAANPGGMVRLTEHFRMFVPTGRPVSPISGTNWEGIGVKADVLVSATSALKVAHLDALRSLETAAHDSERRSYLRSAIEDVEKQSSQ
jgi:retinol-binding protein 3